MASDKESKKRDAMVRRAVRALAQRVWYPEEFATRVLQRVAKHILCDKQEQQDGTVKVNANTNTWSGPEKNIFCSHHGSLVSVADRGANFKLIRAVADKHGLAIAPVGGQFTEENAALALAMDISQPYECDGYSSLSRKILSTVHRSSH